MKLDFALGRLQRAYEKMRFLEQWYLLYDFSPEAPSSFAAFQPLMPPRDRFWADPHLVEAAGRYFVFVEEYLFRAGKGRIAVLEIDEQGRCGEAVPVLEQAYHLSYPCVFEWNGGYYMAPESAANRTIELYECVEFPYRWRFKMNLMHDVLAVDTTLFFHSGRWWLFAGMAGGSTSLPYAKLYLFFADSPLTCEWQAHPLNPLVSDAMCGRPAGSVWADHGALLRPSQDCSQRYGYSFDLNRILKLSSTEYAEERVMSVRPHWDAKVLATHTFARAGRLTVIDAFAQKPRLALA